MDGTSDDDGKYKTSNVRRLSEALAQITDKLMQAAGVDGKMPELPESMQGDGGPKDGKRPWVTVNASGPVTLETGAAPEKKTLEERDVFPETQTGEET